MSKKPAVHAAIKNIAFTPDVVPPPAPREVAIGPDGMVPYSALKAAFGSAFSVQHGILYVDWKAVEIDPTYNAKRPFDLARPSDKRLHDIIEHNRFDDTLPITVVVNLATKKILLARGHSRLAIATIFEANNSPAKVSRIACQVVDVKTWSEARLHRDVAVSNFNRGQDDAELGMTIRRMLAQKESKADICAQLGIDRKKYDLALKTAAADKVVLEMIKAGTSSTFYAKLVAAHGPAVAAEVLKSTKAEKEAKGDRSPVKPAEAAKHETRLTGNSKVSDRGKVDGTGKGGRTGARGPAVQKVPAKVPPVATLPPVSGGKVVPVTMCGPYKVGEAGEIIDSKGAVGYGLSTLWARAIVDVLNAANRHGITLVAGKVVVPPAASAPVSNVVSMVPASDVIRAAAAKIASTAKRGRK